MRLLTCLLSRVLVRYLLLAALGTLGLHAVWQTLWPTPSTAAQSAPATDTSVSRAGYVMLALDQVVLPVKDYLRTGNGRERDEFEQHLRRLHEMITVLETTGGPEERRVMGAFRDQVTRVETLGRALVALPYPRNEIATSTGVQQLTALRDEALLMANDLREMDLKRATKGAQDSGNINGILGGGVAALGFSLAAAVGLARLVV